MLIQNIMSTAARTKARCSTPAPNPRALKRTSKSPETAPVDETLAMLALSCIKGVGYWTLLKLRQQGKATGAATLRTFMTRPLRPKRIQTF